MADKGDVANDRGAPTRRTIPKGDFPRLDEQFAS